MTTERRIRFAFHFDLDGIFAASLFQLLSGIPEAEINWYWTIRPGTRLAPQFDGQAVYHFDTGGIFDGRQNFDHHQADEAVLGESATSLVWKSFPESDQRPDADIIQEAVEYVTVLDNGRQGEIKRRSWSPTLVRMILGMNLVLDRGSRLRDIERFRTCRNLFVAWHNTSKRNKVFLEEMLAGENLKLRYVPALGDVIIGSANQDSALLRTLVRQKFRQVNFIICRYVNGGGDVVKIGLTNLYKDRFSVDMRQVAAKVHELFPVVPLPPSADVQREVDELAEKYRLAIESGNVVLAHEAEREIAGKKAGLPPVYVDRRNFVIYWYLPDSELTVEMVLEALVKVVKESRSAAPETAPPAEIDELEPAIQTPESNTLEEDPVLASFRDRIRGRLSGR